MLCVPTLRLVVASEVTEVGEPEVAVPEMVLVAPICVAPSKNFTVPPVNRVPEAGATVVENVMLAPCTCEPDGVAVGVVVVVAVTGVAVMTCDSADDVEPVKPAASPADGVNCAVMLCVPTLRLVVGARGHRRR